MILQPKWVVVLTSALDYFALSNPKPILSTGSYILIFRMKV